ncbi:hypothetical protein WJX72_009552 [[Myrmecia] bisecta]|uniref:Uncharacterized protein n=1 Tax=[Myrmecia] bisecta TaxID=41462 RepID=A0AAW1PMD8_9CHLO
MQAIQASISQVLTGVRSDMQQLDAKWSSMWQQSAGACSGLQQDLAAMRTEAEVTARHTSSEMEVLASYILPLQERLAQLELRSQGGSPASTRTIQASADRSTTLHHAPPGDQPRQDVEDDRISGVMERLSGLEGKVSAQLDQLVRLHELKVAAIKSNVRTSVSEVASQAASPPTSRLTTPYTSPAKGVAEPDGYYDTEHFYADGHHTHDDGQADTQRIEARHDRNASPIRDRLRQTNAGEHGRSPGARSAYSEAAGAGHAGSGTAGHADWMVNLGEQVGDLQARLGTAASTKSVRLVQEEIGHLRAALEARTAEAGLYRKEYDGLCRKLDKLEAAQKQAAQEARSKVKLQALDAMAASALDKRLLAIEERLNSVQGQAAGANTVAQSVQQRIAALEWRVEKVATTFSATVKTVNNKQERLTGSLTAVRDAASMAEAKCSALGAEVARLHRSATKPGRAPELENCRSSHKRARESPGKSVSDRSGSVLTGRNLEHYY